MRPFPSPLQALAILFNWTVRLSPAMAFLSLFFVMEGGLRWLGLFGLALGLIAFRRDCPTCFLRERAGEGEKQDGSCPTPRRTTPPPSPFWPGH